MSENSGAATSGLNEGPSTVKQTIVASLEAPRLTDITTEAFAVFKEQRANYERQSDEKNTDPSTQVTKTTYRNSVDPSVLDVFVMAQWVPVNAVDNMTEEHIIDCIRNRAEIPVQDYDAGKIEKDIRSVRMDMADKDVNLEKQVWRLCLKYTNTLRNCGYRDFIAKRPKQAVKHIAKRITHPQLRDRMRTVLGTEQDELKNDFHGFIRMLAAEARNIEKLESAKFYVATVEAADSSDSEVASCKQAGTERRKSGGKKNYRKHKSNKNYGKLSAPSNERTAGKKRDAPPPPKCLNPRCKDYHFIRDCPISSEAERKQLKEEYQRNKRSKRAGKVGRIEANQNYTNENSSLFSASFFDGAVETVAMADQGSDANVLFPSLLRKLRHAKPSLNVQSLDKTVTLANALASAKPIRCSRIVQASVRLRIRHGSALSLANIKWFVADDEMDCIYIGRHVLSAIGLDNRKLMAVACDRYKGYVDIAEELEKSGQANTACASTTGGSIRSLLGPCAGFGSSYHSTGDTSSDGLGDTDVYVELGEDTPDELSSALKKQIETAKANGMSNEGCSKLEKLLNEYRQIFECGWENPPQPTSSQ